MAGTPTTNYKIPTYADTDAPDLSGAYNDAMGIIDTQLKANADAIKSASTGNYEGTAPIVVNNEERTISVTSSVPQGSGSAGPLGVTRVTGIGSDWSAATATENIVPNRKAVADYVAAHGGTSYTAGTGISISGTTISNTGAGFVQVSDGTVNKAAIGGVYRCVNAADVDVIAADAVSSSATSTQSTQTVASVGALKAYVESKMAAAGAAYTGTAPVVVDNGNHTIRVTRNAQIDSDNIDDFIAAARNKRDASLTPVFSISTAAAYQKILDNNNEEHDWVAGWTAPTCTVVDGAIRRATPDASTSVKGLVQLSTSPASADSTMAVTGSGVVRLLGDRKTNATTNVTVDMLKNLYVDTTTGVVYYKAPTE